jgi:Trk K+ transport system NAD-binding subunit
VRKQFAVIGMGRISASLVRTLEALGHDVLGLDCDEDLIQDLSLELPRAHLTTASLADLNLHKNKGLTVLAIKGEGKKGTIPRLESPLKEGDVLVIGGLKKELDKLDPSAE